VRVVTRAGRRRHEKRDFPDTRTGIAGRGCSGRLVPCGGRTDVTTPRDPRLDDFERRLHELEDQLAELRLALAAGGAEATVEALGESDVTAWARRGTDRDDI
jgi:hypothetical protein